MKKVSKVLALLLACVMVFSACQKEEANTPANSETTTPTTQTTPAVKEETKTEEKVDPKDEILAKAEDNKEEMLTVLSSVVDTYRSGSLPDYYEAYPAKLAYPKLESTDEISLEKGDGDSDVNLLVKVDNQLLCVGLKYVEGSANPWMVVGTSFSGAKG